MKTIKTLVVGLMMLVSTATFAQPMNYNAIRNNARFLTDRMAYTLGINSSLLLDDIYRINFDYIYAVNEYLDDIALGYRYDDYMQICAERDFALQMLLGDVVWSRLVGYDYFYRPIVFENRRWHFGIYRHDWDRGHYYFNSPRFFDGYRGGHFFSGMRPNRGIGDRGPGMAGWASRPDHAAGNHGNMPGNNGNSSYRGGMNPGMGGNRTGQPDMNRGGVDMNRGNMGADMNRGQGGQPDMNRGNMGSDMNRNQGGSRSQGNVQSSSRGNSYGSTPSRGNSSSFGSNPSRGNSSSYGSTPSRSGSFGSTPSTSRSSSSSSSSSSRSSSFGGSRSGGTFSGTRAGGSSSGSSAGSSSRGGGSTGGSSRSGAGRR